MADPLIRVSKADTHTVLVVVPSPANFTSDRPPGNSLPTLRRGVGELTHRIASFVIAAIADSGIDKEILDWWWPAIKPGRYAVSLSVVACSPESCDKLVPIIHGAVQAAAAEWSPRYRNHRVELTP